MNSKERQDVFKSAHDRGFRQSSSDPRSQIDYSGNKVTHIGSNRTVVNGTTFYGASNAKKKIGGL